MPGRLASDPVRPLAIVVVPGFKGSRLVRATGRRCVWIATRHALPGRTSLALDHPALDLPAGIALEADGVLDTVRVVPGLIELDFYGAWIRRLREHYGGEASVVPFAYDWRQDNVETVRGLHDRVEELRTAGAQRVWIAAHSMGGLVTAYYLRYGKQDPENARENWWGARRVERVVFAGVPFRGAAQMFHDLQHGTKTGLNRSLLSAEALGSFPSSYQLLPAPQTPFFHGADGEPAELPLHEARRWRDHRWGWFRRELAPPAMDRRLDFLRKQLGRTVSFMSRLHAPVGRLPGHPIQIANAIGIGRRARARAYLTGAPPGDGSDVITLERELRRNPAFRGHTLPESGDGSVTERSAALPEALEEVLLVGVDLLLFATSGGRAAGYSASPPSFSSGVLFRGSPVQRRNARRRALSPE